MIIVGVTGSYASGKTFVINYLKTLNYKIFSADEMIKFLYEKIEIRQQIIKLLPPIGEFNTQKIATLIYNNEKWRKILQNFIHPFIIKELINFKDKNNDKSIVFAEIPLLFESNFKDYFDCIITCFCSEHIRYNRAKLRHNFNEENYKKIEEIQHSQSEKIALADYVINTDDEIESIKFQIKYLLKILQND